MIFVEISHPEDAKLIWSSDGVILQNIFYHDYFWIAVENGDRKLKFEVNLPEWLLELTAFLKTKNQDMSYKKNMLLSGENFVAEWKNGGVKIKVFDHNNMKAEWLDLTHEEANLLHSRLVCELISAVDKAAGKPMQIRDLDRLEIRGTV